MGAIVGFINPDIYKTNNIAEKMLSPITYRDSSNKANIYTHRNASIGTLGEKNIACNNAKSIWAILDGEIFNIDEIIAVLIKMGYLQKKIYSQSEVIIYAYEIWGTDCFKKFNGPFAITIYNQRNNEIILARDHIGQKPLYWSLYNRHFIFASELKSILNSGLIPQTPSKEGVASYLYLGFIPQDITAIQGVNKLLPGYYLKYSVKNSVRIKPFWSYSSNFNNPLDISETDAVDKVDELLKSSISKRSTNNSSGCFVSGGLGSACIASYLQKSSTKNISALTGCYENEYTENLSAAESVSKKLHMPYTKSILTAEDIYNDLPKITWYLDEPICDPSSLEIWKMSQMAHKNKLNYIYSSVGSDELFGGDLNYLLYQYNTSKKNINQNSVQKLLASMISYINPAKAYQIANRYKVTSPLNNYIVNKAIFNSKELSKISPNLNHYFDPEIFIQKFIKLNNLAPVSSFLYFETKTSLADRFLSEYDRITSAFNLNYCVPFLDINIIEFLAQVPEEKKLYQRSTAFILKKLLEPYMPKEFIERPKINKHPMLESWRNSGDFQDIMKLLSKGVLVETGYISKKWIQKLTNPQYNRSLQSIQIWSILSLEIWFRMFLSTPICSSPPKINIKELLSQ